MICNIGLEGALFQAPVGTSKAEQNKGNTIRVDISVKTDTSEASVNDDLNQTADYSRFYAIAKKHLRNNACLLETVTRKIGEDMLREFPSAKHIKIRLSKLNPPGMPDTHSVYVEWETSGTENS